MNVERAVLRAAVGGPDNYAQIERVAALLDELEARGVIGADGRELVTNSLACAIVAKGLLDEVGNDLSSGGGGGDTPAPEDPPT